MTIRRCCDQAFSLKTRAGHFECNQDVTPVDNRVAVHSIPADTQLHGQESRAQTGTHRRLFVRVPSVLGLLILNISVLAQAQFPPANNATTNLDDIRKRPCEIQIPEDFTCAVLFDAGIPDTSGMIASIVGGDVPQVSVYLGGMLCTIAFDPPLKRDDKFFHLRRGMHIAVRIERNKLILQWPDQTRSKGQIIRREAVFPNEPQPS